MASQYQSASQKLIQCQPTLFSFETHCWVTGNLKYWVLPDIFHIPRHKIMNHYLHSCPTQTQPLPKFFCFNTTYYRRNSSCWALFKGPYCFSLSFTLVRCKSLCENEPDAARYVCERRLLLEVALWVNRSTGSLLL